MEIKRAIDVCCGIARDYIFEFTDEQMDALTTLIDHSQRCNEFINVVLREEE